jgi:mRNA-degrading endonuclease RelE of RelBE toxin-antitoxin system
MRQRRTNIWVGSSLNITVWSRRRSRSSFPHTPTPETRNRKPLEEPASFGATWQLRFGPKNSFRVFYDVNHEEKTVSVLAIGVKEGNQLFIGGQEFEL